MNALPQHAPVLPALGSRISVDALADCVRALDPGSRALLDLSLRRRLPFEAMAGLLHTDPFDLARRRARAVARIAADLDLEGSGVVATVKAALARLPDEAWGVPKVRSARRVGPAPRVEPAGPEPVPLRAVQAESMAEAARALMDKLRAHREAMQADARAALASADPPSASEQPTVEAEAVVIDLEPRDDPAEQPTVESEAIVLPPNDGATPEAWPPMAATPMAAAYSHHPAFAIEREDEVAALPPLAEALARAAESERAAAEAAAESVPTAEPPAAVPAPDAAPDVAPAAPEPSDRPAAAAAPPHAAERESGRRLARGGLLIGLLLALLRLLFGGRR